MAMAFARIVAMWQAGYGSADISPDRSATLFGYEYRETDLPAGNCGVHDPLHARVLLLDDGRHRAAVLNLELCIVPVALARHYRKLVARLVGTTPERVIVSCTHTHSGPYPVAVPGVPWRAAASAQYARQLERRLGQAARQAVRRLAPVSLCVHEAPLGLGYNRRVRTAAGIRHCWNPAESPHLQPSPADDPTCTVLVLESTRWRYILWSVGVHPVTLGKRSRWVSADWPGAAGRHIDATDQMFLLGAAADSHPWIATQDDLAALDALGLPAAGFVNLLAATARPVTGRALRIRSRTVRIGSAALDLSVWDFGNMRLGAVPAEIFGASGRALRQRLPGPLLLATNTNGWTGYWPPRSAFREGGYEVDTARAAGRRPGDAEKLIAAIVRLARASD